MSLVFKLPAEVLAAHPRLFEAGDWARRPELDLAAALPAAGFAAADVIEAVGCGGSTIVRARHPGTMLRLRTYAATLPRTPAD